MPEFFSLGQKSWIVLDRTRPDADKCEYEFVFGKRRGFGDGYLDRQIMANVLVRRPVQERSRQTEDRVLAATRRLLETKWFSEISLGEIAEAAGCGVGTVYGRFVSKDALLQILKQNFLESTQRTHENVFHSLECTNAGLVERVEKLIAAIVDSYRQHRGIVRELVIGVHGQSTNEDQSIRTAMTELLQSDIELLLSTFPVKKRRLWRKQVGLAVLAAINLIQNRVVFQQTSPLEFKVSDGDLKKEIPKMMIAYLSELTSESSSRSGKSRVRVFAKENW